MKCTHQLEIRTNPGTYVLSTLQCIIIHETYVGTVQHSYDKPEILGQTVRYKQEFVISGQCPMRYCSTWLRSLLCYIKKFAIEEFVIRVFHCISLREGSFWCNLLCNLGTLEVQN